MSNLVEALGLTNAEMVALATNGTLPGAAKMKLQEKATEHLTGIPVTEPSRATIQITAKGRAEGIPYRNLEALLGGGKIETRSDLATALSGRHTELAVKLIKEGWAHVDATIVLETDDE